MNSHEVFIHIHQGCFAGTGAIVRLPQCQWSKPDGYGKISQCITTTKHSKAKTVCIFLGIYCMITSHLFMMIAYLPCLHLNAVLANPCLSKGLGGTLNKITCGCRQWIKKNARCLFATKVFPKRNPDWCNLWIKYISKGYFNTLHIWCASGVFPVWEVLKINLPGALFTIRD